MDKIGFFLLLVYAVILATTSLFAIFCLRHREALPIMCYEVFSGFYFSVVIFLYAFGVKGVQWYWFAVTPVLMLADYWIFYHNKYEELVPELDELSDTEKEVGVVGALIFIAPAYLIGISLLYDSLK